MILPYLDERTLYERYDFDEPWDGPNNRRLQDSMPDVFACPEFVHDQGQNSPETPDSGRLATYAAVVSTRGIFATEASRRLSDVTDGHEETIMITEVRQRAVHWMSPVDVSSSQFFNELRLTEHEADSNHRQGLQVLHVNGAVRFLPHDVAEKTLESLITIRYGDDVPAD